MVQSFRVKDTYSIEKMHGYPVKEADSSHLRSLLNVHKAQPFQFLARSQVSYSATSVTLSHVTFFPRQYINDLAYNMDVQEILIRAEQLCLQLLVYPDLPAEVKAIITGKNEAMMTPNVERTDPFLVAHSRHVNLLQGYGIVKANSAVQTSDLAAFDLAESTQELSIIKESSSQFDGQTDWNDLGNGVPGSTSCRNDDGPNENGISEDRVSDEDEIVVLSEEAQNVF